MPGLILKDQRILVTGGTSKLGSILVSALISEGAKVVIGKRIQADLRDIGQIEKLVSSATESLGGIDILINNAAIFGRTPLETVTLEQWNDIIDINLRAPFFLIKALHGRGLRRVINIADTYGASPAAGFVPYGISKAGLIAMTKGLAKELAPDVLVNCVCPGVIEMKQETGNMKHEEKAINATLLKRPVALDDIVKTVLFLAENNSMTGQTVFVDCGKNV